MENNEQTTEQTDNTEQNNDQKTVLSAGTRIIAPIHTDIVPESPIHAASKDDEATIEHDEAATTEAEEAKVSTEPASTPAVINDALATLPVAATSPVAPPTQSAVSFDEPAVHHGLAKRWFGETKAYLAEYAVQLILLVTVLGLASTFFGAIVDPEAAGGSWTSSWQYQLSIGQLAAVVAVVPLLVLIARRTAGTEADAPLVRESSWRKAFLGVFLIAVGLAAVGYAIQFVYVLLSMLLNAGLAVGVIENPGIALLKAGFSALLFGISALLYAKDYRQQSSRATILQAVHRYGLIVFTVVLAIVFAAIPLQKQRGAYVDSLKVNDMRQLERAVSTYSSKNRKLPEKLDDLELSKEVKARSASLAYQYKKGTGNKYQLCAYFATDASDKKDTTTSRIPSISSLSGAEYNSSYDYPVEDESVTNHKQGDQCFDYAAIGVRNTQTQRQTSTTNRSSSSTIKSTQDSTASSDDELFEAFMNGESRPEFDL